MSAIHAPTLSVVVPIGFIAVAASARVRSLRAVDPPAPSRTRLTSSAPTTLVLDPVTALLARKSRTGERER
jgi:hypothetical protein